MPQITAAGGRKTTQYQHTCSSARVPRLHTALPKAWPHIAPASAFQPAQCAGSTRVHPPPSTRDWELHFQELGSPAATHRLPSFRQQNNLILALKGLTIKALVFQGVVSMSMSWHACAKVGRSLRWEVSPGAGRWAQGCMEMLQPSCSVKPHCFGMPSSPTTCPACTHSFCWNKQVKIKWAEPGGKIFICDLQRTDLLPLQVLFQSR